MTHIKDSGSDQSSCISLVHLYCNRGTNFCCYRGGGGDWFTELNINYMSFVHIQHAKIQTSTRSTDK